MKNLGLWLRDQEESPAFQMSSNTSLSTVANVQETGITLTSAALLSIITAATATAMSQSPTNRALFVNDNASGGVNMSPSLVNILVDIPDISSSISTRINEMLRTHYKTTSAPTIDGLRQNRLSANNNDNARKGELIKNVLPTEGLKTMILETTFENPSVFNNNDNARKRELIKNVLATEGLKPMILETTFENPSVYTKRKIIIDDKGAKIILADDDIYHYMHNQGRLYSAMTHCTSNDIQFICPAATTACDG